MRWWKNRPKTVPAARVALLRHGALVTMGAVGLSVVPMGWTVGPLLVLTLGAFGVGQGLLDLQQARERAQAEQRAQRWPWLRTAAVGAVDPGTWAWMDAAGYARPSGHGAVWQGVGAGAFWTWMPVHWNVVVEEGKPAVRVGAWVVRLVYADGRPLGWGSVRPKESQVDGVRRVLRGRAVLDTGPGGHLAVFGADPVALARAWDPVALVALSAVPVEGVLGVENHAHEALLVLPESWIDGEDRSALPTLVEALSKATGTERWAQGVGSAWAPA